MERATEKTIRVLVANRPRLMRELVLTTFADQQDIEIVGEVLDESDIRASVEQTHPDFLLIALEEGRRRPALCDTLLREFPGLRIIAVAPHTNQGIFYWGSFEIHSAKVEASEESLLALLRRKEAAGERTT